jgi:hypothetical protein
MTIQTQMVVPKIEWDDSVVFVFAFSWSNRSFFAGFVHLQIAVANATGTTTQLNSIVQQLAQSQIQASSDPQSWLETVKTAARGGQQITITFDDSISTPYTTQTTTNYDLQLLYSIAG